MAWIKTIKESDAKDELKVKLATAIATRNIIVCLIFVIRHILYKGERGGSRGRNTPLSGITWAD